MSQPTNQPPGDPTGPPPGQPTGPPAGQYAPPPGPGQYPPAPGGAYGAPPSGIGQPADLLMRFLARLIDFIIIGIVNGIIISIVVRGILGLSGGGYGFTMGAAYGAIALSAVITAILYLGYFTLLESRNGQTVGKMLLKLQTQGPDGGTPSTEAAARRNFWVALGILGVIPIIGGLIGGLAELVIVIVIAVTINNSPTKQGWHDNLAGGTKVIKIG
jgi:uncharacterized RDD family membrane protein YckC